LPDIQSLGFGDGADDRMKGLVMGEGMDAVRAIGEPNDSVSSGGLHRTTFEHTADEAKLKERERPLDQGCIKLVETARTGPAGVLPLSTNRRFPTLQSGPNTGKRSSDRRP
jgi:hypothetical protein